MKRLFLLLSLLAVPAVAFAAPPPVSELAADVTVAQVEAPKAPGLAQVLGEAAVQLIPPFASLLVLVIGAAVVALRQKLASQTAGSKLAQVGDRLILFADTVVRQLEAELRPQLVAATSDGKLTPEEMERLKGEALARLKAILGEKGLKELQEVLGVAAGGLGTFLGGVIEGSVARMKASASPAPSALVGVVAPAAPSASALAVAAVP